MMTKNRGEIPHWPLHLFLIAMLFITIYPVLWVLTIAFSGGQSVAIADVPADATTLDRLRAIAPWPEQVSLDNFRALMSQQPFARWLLNSAIVAGLTTIVGVFLSCTAAYAFSRFRFPGRRAGLMSFLVSQMFPGTLMLIPLYIIVVQWLGLGSSFTGVVLVYATIAIPFCVWMLKGYFDTIPKELEESALIDGASQATIFLRIILPLAKPAVAVTALFFDIRGAAYFSRAESNPAFGVPTGFGTSGFSPVPAGELEDEAFKANVDINDPFGAGLSFNVEYFDLGAEYVSLLAARREVDVLLTEGSDGAFAWPGPDNSAFGVFAGNPSRIGYGGWQGPAQQVATINVDNEFTDFDEPMAESVIGWKGITVAPNWTIGNLDLSGEFTIIDYNTNWQAWGDPSRPLDQSPFPNNESDAGVNSYRNAYAPFQEKETDIIVLRGKYLLDVGKGVDLFGKVKWIDETDERMNDARFLPFQPGDCPGGGQACANSTRFYSPGNSSASIYGNPPVITVNGVTGYQWAPVDDLSDDDREMDYQLLQLGAGYQLSDNLYSSLTFERYDVDLQDGNTAFQAYQLHNMASGDHIKNKVILFARYTLGGAEFGFNYEYNYGEFDPNFGGGFVPQTADAQTATDFGVPVGSLGFRGRFGGWNSLEEREFEQNRLKAFMKLRF